MVGGTLGTWKHNRTQIFANKDLNVTSDLVQVTEAMNLDRKVGMNRKARQDTRLYLYSIYKARHSALNTCLPPFYLPNPTYSLVKHDKRSFAVGACGGREMRLRADLVVVLDG